MREKRQADSKPSVIDANLATVSKRGQAFYKKGIEFAAEGNLNAAVEQMHLALTEDAKFMLAQAQLGILYQKLNELDKADHHLQLALELRPHAFDPLVNPGIVLVRLNRFVEAERLLREAVRIRDGFPVTIYYLGRSLAGLRRYDEAEASYRKAYALDPKTMVEARRALVGLYIEKGDDQKAFEELSAYLKENPSAPDAEKLRESLERLRTHLSATPRPE